MKLTEKLKVDSTKAQIDYTPFLRTKVCIICQSRSPMHEASTAYLAFKGFLQGTLKCVSRLFLETDKGLP